MTAREKIIDLLSGLDADDRLEVCGELLLNAVADYHDEPFANDRDRTKMAREYLKVRLGRG